jgi:hypothetical protein
MLVCAPGQELHQQLDKILSAHRHNAEALAERELDSCCHTDLGDYAGTCSSDSSSSSSDTPGSSVCKDTEEQQYKEQLDSSSPSSSIGASEGNSEAEGIEGSHKEAEGGGGDRGSSGGSNGGSNGGSSGKQSGVLRALKARVLGGSGSGKNSSKDEEMQVGVCGGGGGGRGLLSNMPYVHPYEPLARWQVLRVGPGPKHLYCIFLTHWVHAILVHSTVSLASEGCVDCVAGTSGSPLIDS